MHLTAEQIKRAKFTIEENGYSPKEVDDLLDRIVSDYNMLYVLDWDLGLDYMNPTIKITNNFDGTIEPYSIEFDGTIAEWKSIKDKGIFENVPCINCINGQFIQKL